MNSFRPYHEYFLGLIGAQEFFFHLIFPCANIFFVLRTPPPPPRPPISFLMVRPLSKLALDVRGKGFGWFVFRAFKSYFYWSYLDFGSTYQKVERM